MVKNILSRFYLLLVMLFLYAPIFVLVVLSFNSSRSRVKWEGFTLRWYQQLFSNQQVMEALQTTLLLAFGSALIATVLGLLGALGIDAMKRSHFQITMGLTNIPLLNAEIVTGIATMLFLIRFMPLGFTSILLSHVTFVLPFIILSIMPKLRALDVNVYEAARDLGAGSVTAFFKVVFPCILPGIVSGYFMAFTISLDDFLITYFTKGAGVNTLSLMIYGEVRRGIKPEIYALSTVIFAVILLLLLAVNVLQAVKGKREEVES